MGDLADVDAAKTHKTPKTGARWKGRRKKEASKRVRTQHEKRKLNIEKERRVENGPSEENERSA